MFILVAWGVVSVLDRAWGSLLVWGGFVAVLLTLAGWNRKHGARERNV